MNNLDNSDAWEYQGYAFRVDGQTLINGDLTVSGQIKEVKDMLGLYEVYVIDTKAKHIVTNDRLIAKDEDKAKLQVAASLNPQSDFPENLEFFVRCIGQWEDKRPKEVKIVKE